MLGSKYVVRLHSKLGALGLSGELVFHGHDQETCIPVSTDPVPVCWLGSSTRVQWVSREGDHQLAIFGDKFGLNGLENLKKFN